MLGAAAAAVTMLLAKIPRDHGSHENNGAWASLKEGAFIIVLAAALGLSKSVRALDSESIGQPSISAAR